MNLTPGPSPHGEGGGKKKKENKDFNKQKDNMEDFFEPTETLWKNLGQTLIRHKNDVDGKQIELNIEASTDELKEVLEYAVTTGFMLNIVELPDKEEYDSFTDFLFFCHKIAIAVPKEEDPEMQTVQVRLMISERELKSVDSMLTESVTLMARNKDLTNKNADRLLLIENFRRKVMNSVTAPLNPPQGGKREVEAAEDVDGTENAMPNNTK